MNLQFKSAAAAIYAASLLLLAGGVMAVDDKPSSTNTMGNITNNQGIITQGQIGNNTIYNPPPAPTKITVVDMRPVETRSDGTFVRRIIVQIAMQNAPGNLAIEARGPTVLNVDLHPFGPSVSSSNDTFSGKIVGEGFFAGWNRPYPGKWAIDVTMSDATSLPRISFRENLPRSR